MGPASAQPSSTRTHTWPPRTHVLPSTNAQLGTQTPHAGCECCERCERRSSLQLRPAQNAQASDLPPGHTRHRAQSSGSFSPTASLSLREPSELEAPLLSGPYAEVEALFFAALDDDLRRVNEVSVAETESIETSVALATGGEALLSQEEVAALYCRLAKLRSFMCVCVCVCLLRFYLDTKSRAPRPRLPLRLRRLRHPTRLRTHDH